MVGRLDGRYTALDADAAGERQEFDPSNTALQGAYTAMFEDYVKNDLKWESDLHYPTSGNVRPWTYVQNGYMDKTDALRQTMAKNPFLKVFVVCGYYDMATYVGGAEFNFSHLAYDRQITDRVSFGYYEGRPHDVHPAVGAQGARSRTSRRSSSRRRARAAEQAVRAAAGGRRDSAPARPAGDRGLLLDDRLAGRGVHDAKDRVRHRHLRDAAGSVIDLGQVVVAAHVHELELEVAPARGAAVGHHRRERRPPVGLTPDLEDARIHVVRDDHVGTLGAAARFPP